MELREVQSSNIQAIGYDENKLFIKYLSGSLYGFENVPKEIFEGLEAAESKGRYINANVKNKFEFKKIISL